LPEAWGFVCPVHTPDGAPCGLLNHISTGCVPLPTEPLGFKPEEFIKTLTHFGLLPLTFKSNSHSLLPVLVDGRHIGSISESAAEYFVSAIRHLKIS